MANFLERFQAAGHHVDLLRWSLEDGEGLAAERFPGGLLEVKLRRPTALCKASELLGVQPAFQCWRIDGPVPRAVAATYDAVWASPIRAFGLFAKHHAKLGIPRPAVLVAAINDIYSVTLANGGRLSGAGAAVDKLRARLMPAMEKRLLEKADLILVQSGAELQWLDAHLPGGRAQVLVLPNGVSEKCFAPRLEQTMDLLFVGTLDDSYRRNIRWFIEKVYAGLGRPRPTFTIIGKGAEPADRAAYESHGITHEEFVADIAPYYLRARIFVAPIFKGFGTINKVLEAMAAGCAVVGDPTAFNGIGGFVADRHAVVAHDVAGFRDGISRLLADEPLRLRLGENARALMRRDYDWAARFEVVRERLASLAMAPGRD